MYSLAKVPLSNTSNMLYIYIYIISLCNCMYVSAQRICSQLLGYYVKIETDDSRPPLCAVLSEKSMQLVYIPYKKGTECQLVDCLVLPELPLVFLAEDKIHPSVNLNLLALILLWTNKNETIVYSRENLFGYITS